MKKKLALLLLLSSSLTTLTGCGNNNTVTDASTELIVFAAASMTETLTELGASYMERNKDVTITFNFDSSGTLKTQIEEGADCDIFISAGQKQMNELDLVLEDSRFDILENKVALAVPDGNPANIQTYEDLKSGLEQGTVLLAMGNSDVPVGQYTQKILSYMSLDEQSLASKGSITYGSNVKEVTTQISESTVDCGIIYQTDAYSAGLTVVDTATSEMCGQVVYPAAILKNSNEVAEAEAFMEYLKSEEADEVFTSVGFTPIS